MRFQDALVLCTLGASQALASNNRHASFHARRSEMEKRSADEINWKRIVYDLSNISPEQWKTMVDWDKVNYGGSTSAAAAPTKAPTTTAAYQPQTTETKESKPEKPTSTTSSAPAATTSASSGGSGKPVSDFVSGLKNFGVLGQIKNGKGDNLMASNGQKTQMWIGDDGKWKATFKNDANKDIALLCWKGDTMWVNAVQPQVLAHIPAGQQLSVSMMEGFSGGCGAAFEDSQLSMGQLDETILEVTTGSGAYGCFDVSREINMNGIVMSAQGSKCTSGVKNGQLACAFVCKQGTKCMTGYDLITGAEPEGTGGCMKGPDPFHPGEPSGGCQMGDGEHMQVTIYGNRSWPS